MTIRRFYELSLFVPLAVPLLMALDSSRFGVAMLAVPYLGLVYFARRKMRRMSEPELVKGSLRASFLFAGLACFCFSPILVSAFTGSSSALEAGRNLQGVGLALAGATEYVLLVDSVMLVCFLARLVRLEKRIAFL